MEKINILMVYSANGFGGLPRNLSYIVENLSPNRFRLSVVLLGDPNDEAADLRNLLGSKGESLREFYCFPSSSKLDWSVLKKLIDLIREEKIACLSCHGYKADIVGFALRWVFRCPVKLFSIAHGWVAATPKLKFYDFLDKLVLRFFDKVILVSEGQRQQFGGFFVDRNKVQVINNGIDLSKFSRKTPSRLLEKELGLSSGTKVIGFAGRLSDEKGVHSLLKVFSRLVESHPDTSLLICGDGPERRSLEELSAKLGVKDQVHFLGYRKDVRAFYSLLDVYCSCSLVEGLPNSVLEAMASGVVCVLSDIAGHREVLSHGENGFLFESETKPEAGVEMICSLFEDSKLRIALNDEARIRLQKKFSISKRIEKLEEAYSSLFRRS